MDAHAPSAVRASAGGASWPKRPAAGQASRPMVTSEPALRASTQDIGVRRLRDGREEHIAARAAQWTSRPGYGQIQPPSGSEAVISGQANAPR